MPEDFQVTTWEALEPYFKDLATRSIDSKEGLERWLRNSSELEAVVSEDACWRQVRMTCDTENKTLTEAFNFFYTEIQPHIQPYADQIDQFSTEAGRREALSVLRCNGITKVYVEVYRSGLVVPVDQLSNSVNFLKNNGLEVVGGIATVPGGETGMAQDGPLSWFNWQNPKTPADMKRIMEDAAPLFDQFILDDFFCTADTSIESKQAKSNKSWSEYRRELLTGLASSVFINPAKAKNPDIRMIIKYPQWYDRFHQFGYDVATEPALFDKVYVGTETRGQYTQRFGFVQPYEGFINYRWIASLSGNKIGAAWFDRSVSP